MRAVLIATALLSLLSACGKPGSTIAPPGSPYPRFYPSPAGMVPPKRDEDLMDGQAASAKPQFSSTGSYIDPSVSATRLIAPGLEPGANLPYTRIQSDNPLGQGLGAPTQSPLPPLDSMRQDQNQDQDQTQGQPPGAPNP